MKVSREQARQNHERVLDTAASLLREHGYDGIGVADLMQAAGLTHGGFYRNFASKDELIVKATERALAASRALIEAGQVGQGAAGFRTLVETYVSCGHRDDAASGCILPALATDASRREDPALHAVFIAAIDDYTAHLDALASSMPAAASARPPAAILAEMVGAVVLARAMGAGSEADHLLDCVVRDLTDSAP